MKQSLQPKPLEAGDSVRAKYIVEVNGHETDIYIDGKFICPFDPVVDEPGDNYWLVEYSLSPLALGSTKYQDWWSEDDITTKHYIQR